MSDHDYRLTAEQKAKALAGADDLRRRLRERAELRASRAQFEAQSGTYHRNGIPWHAAPIPPRIHRCEQQTYSYKVGVMRCACGAIASTSGPWVEKNSRRGPWWRFGR